jgi:mono/diheme cytochrome c family protein
MPKWALTALALLVTLTLLPMLLIFKARATRFERPRIHLIPDMDQQHKFKAQQENDIFADKRAMRRPVPGTVARGELRLDERFFEGKDGEGWVETVPIPVDAKLMERGRGRFRIYCSPCHGLDGSGKGMVARRADRREEAKWVPPSSFHTDLVRGRPDGHIFNTISNGIRHMPAYGAQIPPEDRWAIVAYVRALQRSQNATLDDVPPAARSSLR